MRGAAPASAGPELGAAERQRAYQSLANHPLFEFAANETNNRFLKAVRVRRWPAEARLLVEGQPAGRVFFLTEGVVRIVHAHGDSAFTPKILAAPCHFGHLELLSGLQFAFQSVEALTDCVVAELDWADARALLIEDHGLALAWLEDLALQFIHTADAIRHYAFGDLRARLAGVLLAYAGLDGRAEGRAALPFPLSLSVLGDHVAAPKRSILRTVQALLAERLLTADKRGGFTVPDRSRLAAALPFRRLSLSYRGRLPAVLVRKPTC